MTAPQYSAKEFDDQALTCPNCQWKGKGSNAVIIDFYGIAKNKEAHCPECDNTIGVVANDDNSNPPGESATDLSFQLG